MDYRPQQIEEKWQRHWAEQDVNSLTDEQLRTADRPFYNLMMFPYPSAEGARRQHVRTGADIYGRWKRLQRRCSSPSATPSASTRRTSR
jgi:leucyl-tRNA synthetase